MTMTRTMTPLCSVLGGWYNTRPSPLGVIMCTARSPPRLQLQYSGVVVVVVVVVVVILVPVALASTATRRARALPPAAGAGALVLAGAATLICAIALGGRDAAHMCVRRTGRVPRCSLAIDRWRCMVGELGGGPLLGHSDDNGIGAQELLGARRGDRWCLIALGLELGPARRGGRRLGGAESRCWPGTEARRSRNMEPRRAIRPLAQQAHRLALRVIEERMTQGLLGGQAVSRVVLEQAQQQVDEVGVIGAQQESEVLARVSLAGTAPRERQREIALLGELWRQDSRWKDGTLWRTFAAPHNGARRTCRHERARAEAGLAACSSMPAGRSRSST